MASLEIIARAAAHIRAETTLSLTAAKNLATFTAEAADDDGILYDAAMLAEVALDMLGDEMAA
ncbi:MAG TPA: hypothetical protein VGC15_20395 [Acetobacteraceae bacterium]